tara:strand:+ start:1552 stop:2004 length:453 start_codon:yes stop_codon:yes gene_type:complete
MELCGLLVLLFPPTERQMTETEKKDAIASIAQFHGTENWNRWSPLFPQHLLTDGAKYVADTFGAYWLMDAIASHTNNYKADQGVQFWTLRKNGKDGCTLVGRNDAGVEPFVRQTIEYTDFPTELMPFDIWAQRNMRDGQQPWVLMLETEY